MAPCVRSNGAGEYCVSVCRCIFCALQVGLPGIAIITSSESSVGSSSPRKNGASLRSKTSLRNVLSSPASERRAAITQWRQRWQVRDYARAWDFTQGSFSRARAVVESKSITLRCRVQPRRPAQLRRNVLPPFPLGLTHDWQKEGEKPTFIRDSPLKARDSRPSQDETCRQYIVSLPQLWGRNSLSSRDHRRCSRPTTVFCPRQGCAEEQRRNTAATLTIAGQ